MGFSSCEKFFDTKTEWLNVGEWKSKAREKKNVIEKWARTNERVDGCGTSGKEKERGGGIVWKINEYCEVCEYGCHFPKHNTTGLYIAVKREDKRLTFDGFQPIQKHLHRNYLLPFSSLARSFSYSLWRSVYLQCKRFVIRFCRLFSSSFALPFVRSFFLSFYSFLLHDKCSIFHVHT